MAKDETFGDIYLDDVMDNVVGDRRLSVYLAEQGLSTDIGWPTVGLREDRTDACDLSRLTKVSRCPDGLGRFGKAYSALLSQSAFPHDFLDLVDRMRADIECAANEHFSRVSYFKEVGASSAITAGSTSRGTFAREQIDFDLVIKTELRQSELNPERIREATDGLAEKISRLPGVLEYCRRFGSVAATPFLASSSFGVRGKESLVARYDLCFDRDAKPTYRQNTFIDLTFGRLPQLIEYESHFQAYLSGLGAGERERVRREIRLAKLIFGAAKGLYGSANQGFRPHVVEQLVIQSSDYRSSGVAVGSLFNAVELLFEECTSRIDDRRYHCCAPREFQSRFPIWHPGWLRLGEPRVDPIGKVNLWSMLGDGRSEIALEKWKMLMGIAMALHELGSAREEWSIPNLVDYAESIAFDGTADDAGALVLDVPPYLPRA
jgi:hypothetical protein